MEGELLTGLLAFAFTLVLGPLTLRCLSSRELWDLPSARSSHVHPTLRGGGVAPVTGALLAAALSPSLIGSVGLGPVAAAGFGVAGLLDDVIGVPVLRRLVVQVVLAVAAVSLLLPLAGPDALAVAAFAAAVLWLVSYVNAFNFMDGIDGISVAQVLVAGMTWYAVGTAKGISSLAVGGAIAAGAALGFAPFNLPRARMFLGDVGSYFFGAWLATLALVGLKQGLPPEVVVGPLCLYLADTGSTLVRRLWRGEKWYMPHREHVYQRLTALGWSHVRTTTLVAGMLVVSSALGAVALQGSLLLRILADAVLVAVLLGYLTAPRWLQRRQAGLPVS